MTFSGSLSVRLAGLWVAVGTAFGATFATPAYAEPVTLNIVDVAGDLQLTQKGFEAFKAKYPNLVANITYTNAPAPQLPGKIKAMQAAGRSDIEPVDQAPAGSGGHLPGRARQIRARSKQDAGPGAGLWA
jgi:putative spermidine/putrescine transport system substrate-binding protein